MTAIKVPPLGESIVEATVSRWLKKEGDQIAPGDTLVELETDKITVEVPAMSAGVLTKRGAAEGDVVKVDDLLAEIDESGAGAAPASAAPAAAASTPTPQAPAPTAAASATVPTAKATPASDVKASPAAKRVAAEQGVDLSKVEGTGRGGVVSKPDVIESQSKPAPTPTVAAPASATPEAPARPATAPSPKVTSGERETREKMTTRRKRIAEHLLEAQHATAHLTTFNEVDMSAVIAVREKLKERIEKEHGVKLSFMPFFAKAACLALKTFPNVNAQVDGESIIFKNYVNLGIAVAADAGLVVPNIKDADQMGMLEFSRELNALAKRARDGKLTMDDLTGGSFTITNGGVFGSLVSTPIINYPQVAILGLHKTQDRPVAINGKVEIRPMMFIALSYDHRIIEGQQAVQFLVRVKELMEEPASMLIS
jgi:2-oxoglutarate dehydrogenase E2 component (dihydrolipoamide succinyltransferase)